MHAGNSSVTNRTHINNCVVRELKKFDYNNQTNQQQLQRTRMPPISVYATPGVDFAVYGEGFFDPIAVVKQESSFDSTPPLLPSPDLDLDSLIESSPESFANLDLDDLSLADVDQLDIDINYSCATGNNTSDWDWNTGGIVSNNSLNCSVPDRCWMAGANCGPTTGTGFNLPFQQNSMHSQQHQYRFAATTAASSSGSTIATAAASSIATGGDNSQQLGPAIISTTISEESLAVQRRAPVTVAARGLDQRMLEGMQLIQQPSLVHGVGDCLSSDLAGVEPFRPPCFDPRVVQYPSYDYSSLLGSASMYSGMLASAQVATTTPYLESMPLAMESNTYPRPMDLQLSAAHTSPILLDVPPTLEEDCPGQSAKDCPGPSAMYEECPGPLARYRKGSDTSTHSCPAAPVQRMSSNSSPSQPGSPAEVKMEYSPVSAQDCGGAAAPSSGGGKMKQRTTRRASAVVGGQCAVCGDAAFCHHYGVRTCEGCKGFFKRTVQKRSQYVCLATQNCAIDKNRRNRCQYCRFQKCLQVGMCKEVVRDNSLKGRRGRLPSKAKILDPPSPRHVGRIQPTSLHQFVTKAMIETRPTSHEIIPQLEPDRPVQLISDFELIDILVQIREGHRNFANKVPGFQLIPANDQEILLRTSFWHYVVLSTAFNSQDQENVSVASADWLVFDTGVAITIHYCPSRWQQWLQQIAALAKWLRSEAGATAGSILTALSLCQTDVSIVKEHMSDREKVDTLHASMVHCMKEHCKEAARTHESSTYLSRMLTKGAEISGIAARGRTILRYLTDPNIKVPDALAETLLS